MRTGAHDWVFGEPDGPDTPRLDFRVSFDGDAGVLVLSGALDCANAELLASVLDGMSLAGVSVVEIDASAVTFMDCSILSVLVTARRTFEASGGSFALVRASSFVSRFFDLAGEARR